MTRIVKADWRPAICPVCNTVCASEALGVRAQPLAGRTCTLEMRLEDKLCLSCGLIYAGSRPDEEALNTYYRDAHTRSSDYVEIAPDYDAACRMRRIRQFVPPGGRILELGAGTGEFCSELMKAGFTASPIDPLTDESWPGGEFDAILAYLLLEHVYDPRSFISVAAQRLVPNGVLIVEVPDFLRDPVASLVPEHLWHYAPEHLSALFADAGLTTVEVDRTHASRAFAFMIAARLGGVATRPQFNSALVDAMRTEYRRTTTLIDSEETRIQALCNVLAATNPPYVYVWGANEYATRIGQRLSKLGYSGTELIDSASSKIGTFHEGFKRPIRPPIFSGDEPQDSVVLLCSPAWNTQIRAQALASPLRKPRVIDAVAWQPAARDF
jgi:SAM-dependent methyltransferase